MATNEIFSNRFHFTDFFINFQKTNENVEALFEVVEDENNVINLPYPLSLFSVKGSKMYGWHYRSFRIWQHVHYPVYDSAIGPDYNIGNTWPHTSPIRWLADLPAYSYLKFVYVFDGFCTPFLNNKVCGWDGGDCCLPYVDTHQRCGLGEDCTCHWTGLRHPTYKDGKKKIAKVSKV